MDCNEYPIGILFAQTATGVEIKLLFRFLYHPYFLKTNQGKIVPVFS